MKIQSSSPIALITTALLLSTSPAHAELIWLTNSNDRDGNSSVFYVNDTLQKSPDKRYVSATLITNYDKPLNIDGKPAKSIKSKVFYDCANIAMKPGDEAFYSEPNAKGNVVATTTVDKNLTYFKVIAEPYILKIKMVCSLEK